MKAIFIMVFIAISLCSADFSRAEQYTKKQIQAAQKVMANTNKLARVYPENDWLVVEFHQYLYPYDINKRLTFVRAVADADVVLHGSPRSIFFYNPGRKKIAKADKYNGVRLESD